MRRVFIVFLMMTCGVMIYGQTEKGSKIPLTSKSESAINLFYEAERAFLDVNFDKALELLKKAKEADPDFFMADFYQAWYNFGDKDKFLEYATSGVKCPGEMSKGEELLKEALKKLIDDQKADVRGYGKKLVSLYPDDDMSYWILFFFQNIVGDKEGAMQTMKEAMTKATYPAPVYNICGYLYMDQQKYDEALKAFDRYIELSPENPNVYDSKGDYFMAMKEYRKAYDSFMKAYKMGFKVSYKKAQKAEHIADSLGL